MWEYSEANMESVFTGENNVHEQPGRVMEKLAVVRQKRKNYEGVRLEKNLTRPPNLVHSPARARKGWLHCR